MMMRERISWGLTFTAVVIACLTLAECTGWAQDTTDADVAAPVQEQIQRLANKDPQVRWAAAYALHQIGTGAKEAVPALSADLAKDADEGVRIEYVYALKQIGPEAIPERMLQPGAAPRDSTISNDHRLFRFR